MYLDLLRQKENSCTFSIKIRKLANVASTNHKKPYRKILIDLLNVAKTKVHNYLQDNF